MKPGKHFEFRVFNKLEAELKAGNLGISVLANCIHQPKYFSEKRKDDIEFDVSIEVSRLGAIEPFLLWIWECKWLTSRSVPVDDIEEFHSKLEQIGPDKTKGTVITNSNFQQGALSYAKSCGIGLARLLPDDQLVLLMESRRSFRQRVINTMLASDLGFVESKFAAMTTDAEFVMTLHDLLNHELSYL